MKRILFCAASMLALLSVSCNQGPDDIQQYELSNIFGYTYSASFTSSSGTALTPEIVIYDESRLDWNMSSSGMANNEYWYVAEEQALNCWTLLWFSKSKYTKAEFPGLGPNEASMRVKFGIESPSTVSVLVQDNGENDSDMAKMPLRMERKSLDKKRLPGDDAADTDYPTELREPPYGEYYGDSVASSNFFNGQESKRDMVSVSEARAVSFESETWGTWTFAGVAVEETDGGAFELSGTGTAVMSPMGQGAEKSYEAELLAVVRDGVLTATLSADVGAMGKTEIRFESRSGNGRQPDGSASA